MDKDQKKFSINFHQFWHPINIYNNLKRLYFAIIPKGTKSYEITYGFLRIFLKQLHLLNIYYQEWIRRFDTLTDNELEEINKIIGEMRSKPQFSIIMPVYNPDLPFFKQAIESVFKQVYPYWELCIADDASTNPQVEELIKSYALQDSRIKFTIREKNGHISAASNSALELASKEFVALLDHDDKLHPLALYYVAETINAHPNKIIIYSDEDKITKRGKRLDPYFKPDFDYELLLSQNMVSHLGVYLRSAVLKVGGFRIGLEGSQDYDLLLRVLENIRSEQIYHIPRPLYHWRISKKSVASDVNIKPYAVEAGLRALQEHLNRESTKAQIKFLPDLAGYLATYDLPKPEPSVTLIISAERLSITLRNCVADLLSNTNYQNYIVMIVTPASKGNLSTIVPPGCKDKIKIKKYDQEKNNSYAEIINNSMSEIVSEFVCLLDETIHKFPPNWLYDLVGQACQAGNGAVAPKLIDSTDRVFSNGIILSFDKIASHLSKGEEQAVNGYFGWAKLCRGYSALSEKCLLFRRGHWQSVGGMNENIHSPLYCGVDFCLKLKEQGLRNVLRPSIELYLQPHNKSEQDIDSLGQHLKEDKAYLQERWGTIIQNDPAFNPNLSIVDEGKILVNLSPNLNFPGV